MQAQSLYPCAGAIELMHTGLESVSSPSQRRRVQAEVCSTEDLLGQPVNITIFKRDIQSSCKRQGN